MSHHSPPQLLSSAFILPLSFSRVLSFLHQRLCRRVISSSSSRPRLLPPFIDSTSFRPFFTLLHLFPPSFFFRPSALRSLNPSVFMARALLLHSLAQFLIHTASLLTHH